MNPNKFKYIVVHHTAVSYKENPDQWQQTNEYHKQKWNFLSSLGYYGGYNYEISASGSIKQFRVDGEETAAQVGHNLDSLSVALDGNFDIELPTQAQIDALKSLLEAKMALYGISASQIVPHRLFAPKTCYGKLLSNTWAAELVDDRSLKLKLQIMILQLQIQIMRLLGR